MTEEAALLLLLRPGACQPLQVGVVTDCDQPPEWVIELARVLREIPGIEVCLLSARKAGSREAKRPPWLVDRLYAASRARFDPFGELDWGVTASADAECLDAIRAAGCGVLLWLAKCGAPGVEPGSLAPQGVFTVRFGDGNRTIPYWDEVADTRTICTVTILRHDASLAEGRAVRTAEISTHQSLFLTENARGPITAAKRMLGGLCREIQASGGHFEERMPGIPATETRGQQKGLSNLEAARFTAQKLMRSLLLRSASVGTSEQWFVALRPNRGESIVDVAGTHAAGFREVPLPKGVKWMADPFLCETGGRDYLLFEELAAGEARGRIACMEVLADGSCSEMEILLDRPYHLSYPCVVRSNGDFFLLPETADEERIDLYRFRRFPQEPELVASPLQGARLVDTTPVLVDGMWYIFTTTPEPFIETLLFTAERLEGPWKPHPANPISTSVRNSRSAGHLFWKDGRLFRPTQDCSVHYGYAITVNEVTRLTAQEFAERRVSHFPPVWGPKLRGTHTWNESSRWQAVDGDRLVRHDGARQPA